MKTNLRGFFLNIYKRNSLNIHKDLEFTRYTTRKISESGYLVRRFYEVGTKMIKVLWLLSAIIAVSMLIAGTRADETLRDTIKLLQEQVSALLGHRQEDYNALEESLKRAMEKNTELIVLRNEVKQLR